MSLSLELGRLERHLLIPWAREGVTILDFVSQPNGFIKDPSKLPWAAGETAEEVVSSIERPWPTRAHLKVEEWSHWQLLEAEIVKEQACLLEGVQKKTWLISRTLLTDRFMRLRTARKENVLFLLSGHKCTRDGPRVCFYMGTRLAVTYVCTLTSQESFKNHRCPNPGPRNSFLTHLGCTLSMRIVSALRDSGEGPPRQSTGAGSWTFLPFWQLLPPTRNWRGGLSFSLLSHLWNGAPETCWRG